MVPKLLRDAAAAVLSDARLLEVSFNCAAVTAIGLLGTMGVEANRRPPATVQSTFVSIKKGADP
jgi:hypothetical protein